VWDVSVGRGCGASVRDGWGIEYLKNERPLDGEGMSPKTSGMVVCDDR